MLFVLNLFLGLLVSKTDSCGIFVARPSKTEPGDTGKKAAWISGESEILERRRGVSCIKGAAIAGRETGRWNKHRDQKRQLKSISLWHYVYLTRKIWYL